MSWTLRKKFTFEAAHHLPEHDGLCRRVHGHSFGVTVVCQGDALAKSGPKKGMLIDYQQISDAMRPLLRDYLDHHDLNQTPLNDSGLPPTSEVIARWIYNRLREACLPFLFAVIVEETESASCEFSP